MSLPHTRRTPAFPGRIDRAAHDPARRRLLGALALPLAAGAMSACGGSDGDETPPPPPIDAAPLQAVADAATRGDQPGALLTVMRDGSTLHLASGIADQGSSRRMQAGDRFRAGSALKLLVATVVLQLVEEGRIALDAPIDRLLPAALLTGFTHRSQIRLEQLLNHSSGLPDAAADEAHDLDVIADPLRVRPVAEYLASAAAQEQQAPGGAHAYANTNYMLLGELIGHATGMSWRQALRERLLAPLGMFASALPEPEDSAIAAPFARGYEQIPDGPLLDVTHISPSMAGAAGGHALITTTGDLARFGRALFRGELFRSRATLTRMMSVIPAEPIGDIPYAYGLGLMRHQLPGGRFVYGHGGSTAGYACALICLPDEDRVVVAARNSSDLGSVYLDLALPALERLR